MILSGTYSKNDEKVHLKSSSQAGQNINTSLVYLDHINSTETSLERLKYAILIW